MELARISTHGQVTLPATIRKKLGVKDGDKILFFEENGRIVMENSISIAFQKVQEAFAGEAEHLNLKTEQDVVDLVKAVRREVWEEKHGR